MRIFDVDAVDGVLVSLIWQLSTEVRPFAVFPSIKNEIWASISNIYEWRD